MEKYITDFYQFDHNCWEGGFKADVLQELQGKKQEHVQDGEDDVEYIGDSSRVGDDIPGQAGEQRSHVHENVDITRILMLAFLEHEKKVMKMLENQTRKIDDKISIHLATLKSELLDESNPQEQNPRKVSSKRQNAAAGSSKSKGKRPAMTPKGPEARGVKRAKTFNPPLAGRRTSVRRVVMRSSIDLEDANGIINKVCFDICESDEEEDINMYKDDTAHGSKVEPRDSRKEDDSNAPRNET